MDTKISCSPPAKTAPPSVAHTPAKHVASWPTIGLATTTKTQPTSSRFRSKQLRRCRPASTTLAFQQAPRSTRHASSTPLGKVSARSTIWCQPASWCDASSPKRQPCWPALGIFALNKFAQRAERSNVVVAHWAHRQHRHTCSTKRRHTFAHIARWAHQVGEL